MKPKNSRFCWGRPCERIVAHKHWIIFDKMSDCRWFFEEDEHCRPHKKSSFMKNRFYLVESHVKNLALLLSPYLPMIGMNEINAILCTKDTEKLWNKHFWNISRIQSRSRSLYWKNMMKFESSVQLEQERWHWIPSSIQAVTFWGKSRNMFTFHKDIINTVYYVKWILSN